MSSDDTSLSLLERLLDYADADSWRRLVDFYGPLLRRWLRRYEVPAADAEDLVQEVLLVVLRELPRFQHDGRRGAFRAWLRAILAHRLQNYWRQRRRGPMAEGGGQLLRRLEELGEADSGLARLWDQEHDHYVLHRLLDSAAGHFAPNSWRAFCRTVFDEAKPAQVAAELGMSVNAVLIAKSRILRHLRQQARGLLD